MRKFAVMSVILMALTVSTIGCAFSRKTETIETRSSAQELPPVAKPDPMVEMRNQIISRLEGALKPINERLARLEQAKQAEDKQKSELDLALDYFEKFGFTVDRTHGKVTGIQGQNQVTPAQADDLNGKLKELVELAEKKGYGVTIGVAPNPPPPPDKK